MALQLYIKENDEFLKVGSLDDNAILTNIASMPIYKAIGIYLKTYSSKKSACTNKNEKAYFSNLYDYLLSHNIFYINKITADHMNGFAQTLLQTVKPSTVNRHFNSYKAFFNVFYRKALMMKNPCLEIPQYKIVKPKIHLWTDDDYVAVKAALSDRVADVLEFMYLTGARNIEAVNLTWEDVDQDQGFITLRSDKNAKSYREFPISDNVSKLLHKPRKANIYVFGEGSKFTSDSFGKLVKIAVNQVAKNKHITAYGLRHTFCKDLLKKGLSRPMVQKMMGHKDWRTTENYVHWELSTQSAALNSVR